MVVERLKNRRPPVPSCVGMREGNLIEREQNFLLSRVIVVVSHIMYLDNSGFDVEFGKERIEELVSRVMIKEKNYSFID